MSAQMRIAELITVVFVPKNFNKDHTQPISPSRSQRAHHKHQEQTNMGKVHGSLARAGKVKGQTPKVEKADKKRKCRGRAYKKLLYNRRFVNVAVGPGKKRSYNSNATE